MNFAAVESLTAAASAALFSNISLIQGAYAFDATLDRGVDQIGEYDLTGERRDRISLPKATATAAGFAPGVAIAVNPALYTAEQIAAMGKSIWKLDRPASDDGHMVGWWLK